MNAATRIACLIIFIGTAFLLAGCATYERQSVGAVRARQIEEGLGLKNYSLSRETEDKILGLDPETVTDKDIRDTLSKAPAPRIINIHGGVYPVHESMISFSHFLIGMGYPEAAIRNPGDGTYTFSCYEDADLIAGMIAWYYEKEGLRPMIVGHSQGGMQTIKVLDEFAYSQKVDIWNPLTWENEGRSEITDPLTGQKRPAAGLTLPYATSVGAGGIARTLPNQWEMNFRLRTVPDTVEEFTGFYMPLDLLGGDFLGFGQQNLFKAKGTAHVRNIQLPQGWRHGSIPDTQHLLESQAAMDRIKSYHPPSETLVVIEQNEETMNPQALYLQWAEDVWFSIKKHWVIELQRLIRARRGMPYAG
jgi:hypothetical protein